MGLYMLLLHVFSLVTFVSKVYKMLPIRSPPQTHTYRQFQLSLSTKSLLNYKYIVRQKRKRSCKHTQTYTYSHTHSHFWLIYWEKKRAKNQTVWLWLWFSAQNNTQRVSPHRSSLCFLLHSFSYLTLFLPSLSYVLSSFSSLSPSQDQQAGNTSESCDQGAKNTAGVVFASLGTCPVNSVKACTYVLLLRCGCTFHLTYLNKWLLSSSFDGPNQMRKFNPVGCFVKAKKKKKLFLHTTIKCYRACFVFGEMSFHLLHIAWC